MKALLSLRFHGFRDAWRGREIGGPPHVLAALNEIFGQPVSHVRVFERSRYARCHVGAQATTRRDRIFLSADAASFWRDPELMLHEYFHVIGQWQTRRLSVPSYLCECALKGYWRNRFEIEARQFASAHRTRLCDLLRQSSAR